jgi:hypothetical protein
MPSVRLQPMSFFSTGRSGSCAILPISSVSLGSCCDMGLSSQPVTSGGLTPAKNMSEIASPTQITNPNNDSR